MAQRLLFIFLLYSVSVFSQSNKNQTFKLLGSINSDTGSVTLRQITFSDFYPGIERNLSTKIVNGSFLFEGNLKNPLGFEISFNNSYYSNMFIIEPGSQSISIDLNSTDKMPKITNTSMNDQNEYLLAFHELDIKKKLFNKKYDSLVATYKKNLPERIKLELADEIKASYIAQDKVFLKYVKSHPDSYFALWKFVRLNGFGYEEIFDSIFNSFSKPLRNSETGKKLSRYLERERKIFIGAKFPKIAVVNMKGEKNNSLTFVKKFTLIDFWYSNCMPCIAQFEDLKKINEKYSSQFEVVGISTDKLTRRQDWLNAIKTNGLTWKQYWDLDGKEATSLAINAFPTNFLVNSEGKIIKKNIKPAQLEEFLRSSTTPQ